MEQIIKQLLSESGCSEVNGGLQYFSMQDKAYYFLINLEEKDLALITKKDSLNVIEPYKSIVEEFSKIVSQGDPAIEKNSSLFVLVKSTSIASLANLQQQIFLLEEDEYFLKKYVLIYTDDSIEQLHREELPLTNQIRNKVKDNIKFELFASNGYSTDLSEYIVILQLFIKLPFLKLGDENADFKSLSQKLTDTLGKDEAFFQTILKEADSFLDIDFSNPEDEQKINQLLSILPHD